MKSGSLRSAASVVAASKGVVFDLDGTLVDSLRDIAEACNRGLELLGIEPHPVSAYRYLVGEGVPKLCERALGGRHSRLLPRLIDLVRVHYRSSALVYTRPYAGVAEVVRVLAERGVRLGVLSNKPHLLTQRVTRAFWGKRHVSDGSVSDGSVKDDSVASKSAEVFAPILGHRVDVPRKPDPTSLLEIAAAWGLAPGEIVLVGDTPTDWYTAEAAGSAHVGVTWGFRTAADLREAGARVLADTPGALIG